MHRHHDDGAAAPGLAAPERHEVAPESETPARAGLALQGERKEGRADGIGAAADVQIALKSTRNKPMAALAELDRMLSEVQP